MFSKAVPDLRLRFLWLTIGYAFGKLGLEKVDLGVISENKAAIKCYLKAGFKIDKKKPQYEVVAQGIDLNIHHN